MESPNTFNPLQPLLFALAVLIVRYTVISGGFYYLFWVRYKNKFWSRRIQKDARALAIPLFEIKYSLISFLCSALFAILIAWVGSKGGLRIYRNIDEFGWGYFFGSIFISFIIIFCVDSSDPDIFIATKVLVSRSIHLYNFGVIFFTESGKSFK